MTPLFKKRLDSHPVESEGGREDALPGGDRPIGIGVFGEKVAGINALNAKELVHRLGPVRRV